jgi:hypothetical protein
MWRFQHKFRTVNIEGIPGGFVDGLYETNDPEIAERLRKNKDVLDLTAIWAEIEEDEKDSAKVKEKVGVELKKRGRPFHKKTVIVDGVRTSTVNPQGEQP